MKQKETSHLIWLIMTGFSCNCNCIMCSTRPKAKVYSDRTTREIIDDLKQGKKKGYIRVEFTGGEPTIRPDILYLIKTAKDLNYKEIALSTNARMLSYDSFCQKAIKNGLNRITFTLNAHNGQLGNAICRTPGAFEQTVQGIKNILEYPEVEIEANTVVFKLNYEHLQQVGEFIHKLGIRSWHLLDLIPDGYAKQLYKVLAVRMPDLSASFSNLNSVIQKFDSVTFFDFPLCIFLKEIRNNPKINFVNSQIRTEEFKQVGYNPNRFSKINDNYYEDIHKVRIPICKKCPFFSSCGGIWKNYLELYSKKDIYPLIQKNIFKIN